MSYVNAKANIVVGYFSKPIKPMPAQLTELETWFKSRRFALEMGEGKSGIGAYQRIRKGLISGEVNRYVLYGGCDRTRDSLLTECWSSTAAITPQSMLVAVDEHQLALRHLFEDFMGLTPSKLVSIGYARTGTRGHDAVWSDYGLCFGKVSDRDRVKVARWGEHLRAGEIGTKLRDVYPINVFRSSSIFIGQVPLEDWIQSSGIGKLSLDGFNKLNVWVCDEGEANAARKVLLPFGVLVAVLPD